jgi:hypothetical protein
VHVEVVPWTADGVGIAWSWPGQEGVCAECATAALKEGALLKGRAVQGVCPCSLCGAPIAAVDADSDGDGNDDELDLGELDPLDAGELDPLEAGELDLAQMCESDECFPEPPDIQRDADLDSGSDSDRPPRPA